MTRLPAPSLSRSCPTLLAHHERLTGYRPGRVRAPDRRPPQPAAVAVAVADPPAGLVGAADAAAALGLPVRIVRNLAQTDPALLPPFTWSAGEPCFHPADLAARS